MIQENKILLATKPSTELNHMIRFMWHILVVPLGRQLDDDEQQKLVIRSIPLLYIEIQVLMLI